MLRQKTIVILNKQSEVDWTEVITPTKVKYVSVVDKSTSRNLSNIGAGISDSIIVTIDLNDYESTKVYKEPDDYTSPNTQFTLRDGDKILYDRKEYEITDVTHMDGIKGGPNILEVSAK